MKWKVIDQYHMTCGDWTISKAMSVPYPYGLWFQKRNLGYFTTSEAAKNAAMSEIAAQA